MNTLKISYYGALLCLALQFILLGMGTFDKPGAVINGPYDILIGLLWTAIKGIPWLVLAPALIMKSKNAMAWMSYVCLVYFIIWILAAFSAAPEHMNTQGNYIATIGVFVTVIQFIASNVHTRLSKRL